MNWTSGERRNREKNDCVLIFEKPSLHGEQRRGGFGGEGKEFAVYPMGRNSRGGKTRNGLKTARCRGGKGECIHVNLGCKGLRFLGKVGGKRGQRRQGAHPRSLTKKEEGSESKRSRRARKGGGHPKKKGKSYSFGGKTQTRREKKRILKSRKKKGEAAAPGGEKKGHEEKRVLRGRPASRAKGRRLKRRKGGKIGILPRVWERWDNRERG